MKIFKTTSAIITMFICMFSGTAQAITIDISSMDFGISNDGEEIYTAYGSLSTDSIGDTFSTDPFSFQSWFGTTMQVFDTVGTHTWAGTTIQGDYNHNFTLAADQYAFGSYFSWGASDDIALIVIFDCSDGVNCNGVGGQFLQAGPIIGQEMIFNGTLAAPIPIPAAVWLFGSGLIGLFGFARRKKA